MKQYFSYSILILLAIMIAVGMYCFFQSIINHDVALNYYYSRCIFEGQKPYIDFIDMNAPIIWYLFIPIYFIEFIFSYPPDLLIRVFVISIAVINISLSLHWYRKVSTFLETIFIGLSLFTIVFLTFPFDLGQREHIIVILILPLMFSLMTLRLPNTHRFSVLLFYSSAVFTVGIAIKPMYFILIIPLLLDSHLRRKILYNHSYIYGFLSSAIIIGSIYMYHFADYYSIFNFFSQTYFTYTTSYQSLLNKSILAYIGTASFAYFFTKKQNPSFRLQRLWIVMSVLALFCAVLQHKGFPYHYIPTVSFALISLLFSIITLKNSITIKNYHFSYLRELILFLFLLMTITKNKQKLVDVGKTSEYFTNAYYTMRECEVLSDNSTILNFSTQIDPMCYALFNNQTHIATQFSSMWFIPAFYKEKIDNPDRNISFNSPNTMTIAEKNIFDNIVKQCIHSKPSMIIVNNSDKQIFFNHKQFNFIHYYCQDSSFNTFFKNYKKTSSHLSIDFYNRHK